MIHFLRKLLLMAAVLFSSVGWADELQIELPSYGVTNQNLAVIVKRGDLLSVKTAEYYQQKRNIPPEHIFTVDLPETDSMGAAAFKKMYQALKEQLPEPIQGMVLTWQKPYRVGCMSVTSAFTLGFDPKYCQEFGKGCRQTANSPYFDSFSSKPWQELAIRPSMLLTGRNWFDIKRLIDRGVISDGRMPMGSAYLVRTSDRHRSSRWPIFKQLAEKWTFHDELAIEYIDRSKKEMPNYLQGMQDIMLYQTGGAKIPFIDENVYLPGAIADHLTSAGGFGLGNKGQMKAFRWLEAGATGSYGTVVEPCNFQAKFPNPAIIIPHYLSGETLIEAYWKSVKQPGEGLFIGEPLARPYGYHKVYFTEKTVLLKTRRLNPLRPYKVLAWDDKAKQYQQIKAQAKLDKDGKTLVLKFANTAAQRFKIVDVLAGK
ncbi:MAG: TIGR03790 family protein [Pseudomonadota bacterium]|nr:TIGR03790 family protein [Pseudomonadota bacterium]